MNRKVGRQIALTLLVGVIIVGMWGLSRLRDVYGGIEHITDHPDDCAGELEFAVIGDYGIDNQAEAEVAAMVNSWNVDFVTTVGDNNYPDGEAETIDANVGQYFHEYIGSYKGAYGPGADVNRFFPALGNHDWNTPGAEPYLAYFTLPGNERYYDVMWEPVHLFILDSDPREPHGRTPDSIQGQWLQQQLSDSKAPWKLIVMHHTPYTSALRRNADEEMRWPFAEWGATTVLAGHDHFYERLRVEDTPYFINGAGGRFLYAFGRPEPESVVRYNQDHGAMRVEAEETCLNFTFYNTDEEIIDSYTIDR